MPDYTIENSSPLIRYEPAEEWREGDPAQDPLSHRYSGDSSFTLTTTSNASATFTFTGTSVVIKGALRVNHGQYSVTLDGEESIKDGFRPEGLEEFQVPLFEAAELDLGEHLVVIRNMPTGDRAFLDIDMIKWSSAVASETDNSKLRAVEDVEFSYEPANAWSSGPVTGLSNTTEHSTSRTGATSTLKFKGTGFSILGPVGPERALYSVSLDGGSSTSMSALKPDYRPNQMLYQVDNLLNGDHTVTFTCDSDGVALCAIDYGVVVESPNKKSGLSVSKEGIAGIIVGSVVFLGILVTFLLFIIRRRRHSQRTREWREGYAARAMLPPLGGETMLPPAYQPPGPHDRIAAWASEATAATLGNVKVRPPSIHVVPEDSRASYAFGTSDYAVRNPERVHPASGTPPFHLPSLPTPTFTPNRPFQAPPLRAASPQPSMDSRASGTSFWPKRLLRGSGKGYIESEPDPSFGRDLGNGKKFVDLVG